MLNPRHLRSPRNQILNNFYADWYSGMGVLASLVDPPWKDSVNSEDLDLTYHGEHSGAKFISPLCYNFIDDETGTITEDGIAAIAKAIKARYYLKWTHLWELYNTEYDPLHTYDITETGEKNTQGAGSGTDTETLNTTRKDAIDQSVKLTGTVQDAPNITTTTDQDTTNNETTSGSTQYGHVITTDQDTTNTQTTSQWGFNTSADSAVPITTTSGSGTNDTTETHSGNDTTSGTDNTIGTNDVTVTQTGTDTTTYNTTEQTDGDNTRTTTGTNTTTKSHSDTGKETYENSRKGNLYHSPAELLEADRAFWLTDYFDIVFADLDKLLTLPIYSERDPRVTII